MFIIFLFLNFIFKCINLKQKPKRKNPNKAIKLNKENSIKNTHLNQDKQINLLLKNQLIFPMKQKKKKANYN